ncbi:MULTISPECIES: DUF2982 domain-containing protein [unclassified Shewanella]|uniref:DUF2982 domain-containing protein n=1 Tax=unclassified Shewanella TaxID=196818 RepID=UPI000C815C8B|nr:MULTISPECIES: DUF2982 domain-containing protein [unclassified Shewanella]MDO6620603.1 DUF2982 domain-containing protein [Shewanella sp. 6_MG-2023]MDO6679994.1 DUF2982 domain-containing protein [Shewanella sp. 4_MG-2023]MDO6776760.1 DUF2982 domain-containing protein [Shewanella sp. 3_MG-2023]PMG39268.1 hypothetical protein BCU91_15325 [Shewanella sp. 10N.286.52.B9]PMH87439.1 hypothetical protein BCU57_07300 [Shewanella sp. 10N.286.48.B5]
MSDPSQHERSEPLFIAPHNKRNGISLTIAGGIAVFISLILFINNKSLFGVGMVFFAVGSVGLVLGVAKINQPKASFKLSAAGFDYYHGRGTVHVAWDNVQRIDVSRVTQNLELIELPYIGIKLKHINPILDCISPRLATGLLTEQRPLLMTAATQDEDLQSLETYVGAEFTPLVVNGERYRGVLAMFGHRCQTLDAQLGFHLYLSIDSLDRAPAEFVSLLRQWQQQSIKP